ncbi:hypothetical protein [Aeromonas phage AS-sw]|uniref:CapR homology domain-containing protein n=1 Tax=Aeromonas phage AS-sw TaxID=2026113 RepID=A0A291LGS1_9CAUD|nr:endonuclease [Aeromonas phage AS-sw]ATI18275.1 hypothetical protein [Aeromonas phage AS-sw]
MKKDNFVGMEFPTHKGGVLRVIGVHETVNRVKKYHVECSICSKDKELFPDLFSCTKILLTKGGMPCMCSHKPMVSEEQRMLIVSRVCNSSGYKFIGFVDGYKTSESLLRYVCPSHGVQTVRYNSFVNRGSRCPDCNGNKRGTTDKVRTEMSEYCESLGYKFVDFVGGEYKNCYTKFEFICPEHETQFGSCLTFKKRNQRCPSCSATGYDTSKPGWFYVYKYKMKGKPLIYKYGITNRDPKKRSSEHTQTKSMEISENVFKRLYDDGNVPFNIEQKIKQQFSGVSDWLYSGNTETIYERDLPRVLSIIQEV